MEIYGYYFILSLYCNAGWYKLAACFPVLGSPSLLCSVSVSTTEYLHLHGVNTVNVSTINVDCQSIIIHFFCDIICYVWITLNVRILLPVM